MLLSVPILLYVMIFKRSKERRMLTASLPTFPSPVVGMWEREGQAADASIPPTRYLLWQRHGSG